MPRTPSVPHYRHHKPSGQADVTVRLPGGRRRDVHLGRYNSPESRQEYARIVAELAAVPRAAAVVPTAPAGVSDRSVNEVLLAFWKFAQEHYRRADGSHANEVKEYRLLVRLVRD